LRTLGESLRDAFLGGSVAANDAVTTHLEKEIDQELSVLAPTKVVVSKVGRNYVRALTPAQHGAPPRMVSGVLRAVFRVERIGKNQVGFYMNTGPGRPNVAVNAQDRSTSFPYGPYHEMPGYGGHKGAGRHRFIRPVIIRERPRLGQIVLSTVKQHVVGTFQK